MKLAMRWGRSLVFAMEDPVCARLWAILGASITILVHG